MRSTVLELYVGERGAVSQADEAREPTAPRVTGAGMRSKQRCECYHQICFLQMLVLVTNPCCPIMVLSIVTGNAMCAKPNGFAANYGICGEQLMIAACSGLEHRGLPRAREFCIRV